MIEASKCHFIGIGGMGMSGLARILIKKDVSVSGSDLLSTQITDNLQKEGAKIFIGHSTQNITKDMTIVYSTDIKKENPELQAAQTLNCHMLHRSDLLMTLMQGHKALAIAGTHGKTTTTALLTAILMEAGLDPTFAIGGILPHSLINADTGKGEFFIAEADESDRSFLKYHPFGAIVTNIDADHMDFYKTEDKLCEAFSRFIDNVISEDHFFWCGDDLQLNKLNPKGYSYGYGSNCALRASHYYQDHWRFFFDIHFKDQVYSNVEVALTGRHNALNSLAVFGLALTLGIPEQIIRKSLMNFSGVCRRCEKKGEKNGILFIDDYAHHPTEIKATLKGIRHAIHEKRLIVVFQPHRYTRTQECLGTYKDIFDEADVLYVTDIYSAGEVPIKGLSSALIMDELKQYSKVPCYYIPREKLAAELSKELRPHDTIVGLGAGDITKLTSELFALLSSIPIKKLNIGIIYGGRSLEHEVSLLSANNILKNFNEDFYEISHFGITKQGKWILRAEALDLLKSNNREIFQEGEELVSSEVLESLNKCDVFFPILHGPFGEDGTLQGFFEILGKPYIGCDYRASAVCMDKALTKKLMILNGVPTSAFIDFDVHNWKTRSESLLDQIQQQLQFPVFVKPVHLGSTIGVKKVETPETLCQSINEAFLIDNHVLVENGLNIRELEFAVYGNDWVTAYPPGEVFASGSIYDFQGKYSENGIRTSPKACLTEEITQEGIKLASQAYKAAGCSGMARVDCFLDESNKLWLNEINPIPGFTHNSLYPSICRENHLPTSKLIDILIILAMARWRRQKKITL